MEALNKKLTAENAELRQQLTDALASSAHHEEQAKNEARQSSILSAALETVPVGIVLAEAPSGEIFLGNSRVEELVGHPVLKSEDTDSYGEWVSFHPDGKQVESHEYPLSRVIRNGEEYAELDVHYQRGDGARFWMKIVGRPIRDNDGEMLAAAVALIDIEKERQLQRQQEILIGELDHRVKNAFTVVKSIVSQSLRKDGVPEGLRETIDRRLDAYAAAHAGLVGRQWKNSTIAGIVHKTLGQQLEEGRVRSTGPDIELPEKQALALSMALYELSTNAFKYGALSVDDGTVELIWSVTEEPNPMLQIDWMEHGGPVTVEPEGKGFGTFIIKRALAMETQGSVTIEYPATGLTWQLIAPLAKAKQD
ncbi:HWE histidine kinase domain-containing protein [Parasphingopyxis lamellibrachiae]|uniref:histidine kinase n=1 Tax=Parasphingopyxis lamellibrachiae TaxID=680125 RepID=A0A3D9FJP9_9SPHN|nr:HWE histidine kinase domain-containing protein [Parasphingopyxis lamellibrachiae]RED17321.1 PAS domain S-box-containing protein [Parasphingopyxis lamellibrachiae]